MKLLDANCLKINDKNINMIKYKDNIVWIKFVNTTSSSYNEEIETITTLSGSYTYDLDNEQLTYIPGTNDSINYDSDDESLTF